MNHANRINILKDEIKQGGLVAENAKTKLQEINFTEGRIRNATERVLNFGLKKTNQLKQKDVEYLLNYTSTHSRESLRVAKSTNMFADAYLWKNARYALSLADIIKI